MSEWWWRWRCAPIKYAGTEFANRDTKRPPVARVPTSKQITTLTPAPVVNVAQYGDPKIAIYKIPSLL